MSDRWMNDQQFEQHTLKGVEEHDNSYTLSFDGGVCLGLDKAHGVRPIPGATVRLFGKGFGYPVRGVVVDGECAFYRTEAEEEAKRQRDIADSNMKQRADFEAKREDNDRRIALLPEVFQARFYRFRAHNPNHRWKFEGYELFACEEAVKFAAAMRKQTGAATAVEKLRIFAEASNQLQRHMIPEMSDGHSGNTFGFACQLARAYLEDETLVPKMHGALAALVGCEEYGCPPVAP